MPSKAEKNYLKRMNTIKTALMNLSASGSMTRDTHSSLLNILETEVEVHAINSLPKQPVSYPAPELEQQQPMIVNRASIPDEIPPPVVGHEDEHGLPPPPDSGSELVQEHLDAHDFVPEVSLDDAPDVPQDPNDDWFFPEKQDTDKISYSIPTLKSMRDGDEKLYVDTPYSRSMQEVRNKLRNKKKIQSEYECKTVPESEIVSKDMNVFSLIIGKGHLFMACIRCSRMIMVKFQSDRLPTMPISHVNQYVNGIVMTMCKQCEAKNVVHIMGTTTESYSDSYVDQFNSLMLSPNLMQNSNVLKTSAAIVGGSVPLMERKDQILYMKRDQIVSLIKATDTIQNVNMLTDENQDMPELLTSFLTGGFI